ncbi:hypothetical protein HDU98_010172 [Podochytrium sp. JEL0797]|nr:hypothetical protein HDU98_010172 [Podochytrium sp. JEL0797]
MAECHNHFKMLVEATRKSDFQSTERDDLFSNMQVWLRSIVGFFGILQKRELQIELFKNDFRTADGRVKPIEVTVRQITISDKSGYMTVEVENPLKKDLEAFKKSEQKVNCEGKERALKSIIETKKTQAFAEHMAEILALKSTYTKQIEALSKSTTTLKSQNKMLENKVVDLTNKMSARDQERDQRVVELQELKNEFKI